MVFLGDGFMRIQMAYVGSSLSAYGFRLLTSIVRRKNPETACSFVMFYNVRLPKSFHRSRKLPS